MKQLSNVVLCLVFSVSYGQQLQKTVKDNGNIIVKERILSTYNQVVSKGSTDVILVEGEVGKIRVEASENVEPYILTSVENNTLTISLKQGYNYAFKHKVIVYVPVNQYLKGISVIGSGDISMKNELNVDELQCSVSGSGDISINLNTNKLVLKVSGSGDIKAIGTTNELEAEVKGSGDVEAFELKANIVNAQILGSGDISVYAQNEIVARVTGSGDIKIKGNPQKRDTKTSGSGDITFR